MLPTRIQLNKKTWDKLQYLQTQTRITPNIMARLAINLALRDTRTATVNTSQPDQTHTINRDVLFGEHEKAYETMIRQFYHEQGIESDIQQVIRSLIDSGLHKLGHLRKFSDIQSLFQS
ncbi:MAG: DndE family protein [Alcanivorax sp.]|jgi:DNA sulfur modification protein DndE|uniref:DndE family protein n=1 Tax=Alcanivorax sp. TaxID=1872427 RepID=UPI0032D8E2AD